MENSMTEEVKSALADINVMLENIRDDAKERSQKFGYEISPYRMQTPDGGYLMAPLLAAKAQLLFVLFNGESHRID